MVAREDDCGSWDAKARLEKAGVCYCKSCYLELQSQLLLQSQELEQAV
jgi:hypothetical protein